MVMLSCSLESSVQPSAYVGTSQRAVGTNKLVIPEILIGNLNKDDFSVN